MSISEMNSQGWCVIEAATVAVIGKLLLLGIVIVLAFHLVL